MGPELEAVIEGHNVMSTTSLSLMPHTITATRRDITVVTSNIRLFAQSNAFCQMRVWQKRQVMSVIQRTASHLLPVLSASYRMEVRIYLSTVLQFAKIEWWWRVDGLSLHPLLQLKNSHECANEDRLWQTVQFIVHAGMRMIVDSCVAVPAASSMWTVQRRRSGEDRSGLCVSLERQGCHVQLNAGTDGWGSRRPVDTWWSLFGARLWRLLNTSTHSLNSTRCRMGSQYRKPCIMAVMLSYFRLRTISRVAPLRTAWSCRRWTLCTPTRNALQ